MLSYEKKNVCMRLNAGGSYRRMIGTNLYDTGSHMPRQHDDMLKYEWTSEKVGEACLALDLRCEVLWDGI